MTDPIRVAGVADVVAAAAHAIHATIDLIDKIEGAPTAVAQIRAELNDTQSVLRSLANTLESNKKNPSWVKVLDESKLSQAFKTLRTVCESFASTIPKWTSISGNKSSFIDNINHTTKMSRLSIQLRSCKDTVMMTLSFCALEGQIKDRQTTEHNVELLTQEKEVTRLLAAQRAEIEGLRPEEEQLQIIMSEAEDNGDIDEIERVEEDIRDISRTRLAISQFATVSEYIVKFLAATRTNQDIGNVTIAELGYGALGISNIDVVSNVKQKIGSVNVRKKDTGIVGIHSNIDHHVALAKHWGSARSQKSPSSDPRKGKNLTMSNTYGDLGSLGLATTIGKDFETKYDPKGGAISRDEMQNAPFICHLYEDCLNSYEKLLFSVQTDSLFPTHLTTSLVSTVKDEFSRLRIWGEQTYAVLPQNARRSLDERLREDKDTREIVTRCLRRLKNYVEQAIEQTKRYSSPVQVGTEDEEYSSSSDDRESAQEDLTTTWEIKFYKTIKSISEGVRSLYRVSALLRRLPKSSESLGPSNSTIQSRSALRATLDYAHVSERMRHWRRSTQQPEVGGGEQSQPNKEDEQQEIAEIAFLYQRFTWANLCRRKQLDYWTNCPDEPEEPMESLNADGQKSRQKDKTMLTVPTSLSDIAESAPGDNTESRRLRIIFRMFILSYDPGFSFDAKKRDLGTTCF
ncbi:hypothetical protein KCU65_g6254, partial [Aureobasidium melanogenum]